MPGLSLWLVPPEENPIGDSLSTLISSTVPKIVRTPAPRFTPHVTLTSLIPRESIKDPQEFLKSLCKDLVNTPLVRFDILATGTEFFKKLFIRCEKDDGLFELALRSREIGVEKGNQEAAEQWVNNEYDPHCSLLYSDEIVTSEMRESVEVSLASFRLKLNFTTANRIGVNGWAGGRVWLVSTDKEISEWKPIAEVVL